ncbi:MAG: T9SS type A sorting domain-containing protein [Bacteroidetes bacterium]|nr:T9SS type A sorting domain-containing protein [Bacteroidota bacterium]
MTYSSSSDNFPLYTLSTSNLNDHDLDSYDGFIAMFNANYEQMWCTYFGGNGNDDVRHIAQNESGQIYATGMTTSTDLNVFQSNGYYDGILDIDASFPTSNDLFILKFNTTKELVYSTYFGGDGYEYPYGMDFQFQNFTGKYDLIIVGHTTSANALIPANSQQFPLSTYIGSLGTPYYAPMLNITPNGPAAFISNIYNVSTPLRIGGIIAMPKQTVLNGILDVFPNPFTNLLNLGSINCFIYQVSVFDIQGRKVYSNQLEQIVNNVQIDLNFLDSGIYFVETWDGYKVYVKKIVKL